MSVTFADIKVMLNDRPSFTWAYEARFHATLDDLAAQGIVYSAAEKKILTQMARAQNKAWPSIAHPRVVLYASAYEGGKDKTVDTVRKLSAGDSVVTRLCALVNADLRVYELDLETSVPSSGLNEAAAVHAISYGLMAVDEHVDCLMIDALSEGAEKALQAIAADANDDVLSLLARYAGHDVCAMTGAVFAARMARIPVLCTAPCRDVFRRILSALTDDTESVLLATEMTGLWPNMPGVLQHLNELRGLLAVGPQHKAATKTGAQLLLPPAPGAARVGT